MRRACRLLVSTALWLSPLAAAGRDFTADDLNGISWRSIGPANMGGRVGAIALVPGSRTSFYVGYGTGGLWRTTNMGTTFKSVFDKQPVQSIGAVAVADAPENWPGWAEEEKAAAGKTKVDAKEQRLLLDVLPPRRHQILERERQRRVDEVLRDRAVRTLFLDEILLRALARVLVTVEADEVQAHRGRLLLEPHPLRRRLVNVRLDLVILEAQR